MSPSAERAKKGQTLAAPLGTAATATEQMQHGADLEEFYGEMLPDGLTKALTAERLGATGVRNVLELGMGTGKLAMQVFAQVPTVQHVIGIELVQSRFAIGAEALRRLAAASASSTSRRISRDEDGVCTLEEDALGGERPRVLEFRCGDMLALTKEVAAADVLIMEVAFGSSLVNPICELLSYCSDGCRLLSFYRLEELWVIREPCRLHPTVYTESIFDWYATS